MTKENATSLELLKQSELIRKQSEALKKKEAPDVLARIREAVAHYGFTAADLGLAQGRAASKGSKALKPRKAGKVPKAQDGVKSGKPKTASVIRFRDSQGHTWSGFGRKPAWYLSALAAGATPESLKA